MSLPIDFNRAELAMSGSLTGLNVFNLIQGSANFALSDTGVNVATGGSTLDGATLIQVGLSNIQASVGAGGFGLTVTGGDLGLAIITAPAPATGTDSRYWIAVNGSGLAASLALGGVTASVQSLDLQVDRAGGTDASNNPAIALDWLTDVSGTTIPIDPGASITPTPVSLPIDDSQGAVFTVGGDRAQVNIFNIITGSADFALRRSTTNV